MADKYPTLTKMGINNPDQIQSYTVSSADDKTDILRIKYVRPSGSLLPVRRSYEFDRIPRATEFDAADGGSLTTYEISHLLNAALLELDDIVRAHSNRETLADEIMEQLQTLEREFIAEISDLRRKLEQLKGLG